MGRKQKSKVSRNRVKRQRVLADPKFLIGILLIVISIALTSILVAKAKGGATYYELLRNIPAGQKITATDLRQVSARLESDAYLPSGKLPEGAIAIRSLTAGELLPKAAISKEKDQKRRQLVVKVSPQIPSTIQEGSHVELWVVPDQQHQQESTKATVIATDVVVFGIPESDSRLGTERQQTAEISVPASEVGKILQYTNDQYQLVLVPKG